MGAPRVLFDYIWPITIAIGIMILLALCFPARAGMTCYFGLGRGVCFPAYTTNPLILRREGEINQERDRQWLEYCQPTYRVDRYGVSRAVYAKPRCEFGAIGP